MNTFLVFSSHGEITADKETGNVIKIDLTCDCKHNEQCINNIKQFDVNEFKMYYSKEIPESVDILDLGYWLNNGGYEEPAHDWREEIRRQFV